MMQQSRPQADHRVAIPYDLQDEVETWFRQWGRHARLEWNVATQGPMLRIERFANDPMREREPEQYVMLYDDEKMIEFRKPSGRVVQLPAPLDIFGLGVGGLRRWLDAHNSFGTNPAATMEATIDRTIAANEKVRDQVKTEAREAAREAVWERRIELAPRVPVGITLESE